MSVAVNFHSNKEPIEVMVTVMENQPDGPAVRLRLKSAGNMVDFHLRSGDDAYAVYRAAEEALDYFEPAG